MSAPLKSANAPDDGDRERNLLHDLRERIEDVAKVDDGDVVESGEYAALELRALERVVGRLDKARISVRNFLEPARPEDEHEAAIARVTPLHIAHARDRGFHRSSHDIERNLVAHIYLVALAQARLDRDFEVRRMALVPEPPGGDALVVVQVVAVGDRVLAAEPTLLAHLLVGFELGFRAIDAHDTRAQHRDEVHVARA